MSPPALAEHKNVANLEALNYKAYSDARMLATRDRKSPHTSGIWTKTVSRVYAVCMTFLVVLPLAAHPAPAGTLTTIYDFTSGAAGADPVGGVIQDSAGTLYGQTYLAGAPTCSSKSLRSNEGCGTIYSYSAATGLRHS